MSGTDYHRIYTLLVLASLAYFNKAGDKIIIDEFSFIQIPRRRKFQSTYTVVLRNVLLTLFF